MLSPPGRLRWRVLRVGAGLVGAAPAHAASQALLPHRRRRLLDRLRPDHVHAFQRIARDEREGFDSTALGRSATWGS